MRIVIPLWTFSKSGGTRVLARLATEFTKEGHDVLILCCANTDIPYYPTESEIKYVDYNGFFVEREKKPTPSTLLAKILDIYNRSQSLLKGLNMVAHDYDVVIANYSMTAFPVNKCNIKEKYYYIQAYEAWENGAKNIYRKIMDFLIKKTYTFPLTRIVNADVYKNYKEIKSEYVVPPGLDLNTYYPKKHYWDGTREIIVGCIGRQEKWKGSDDVAQAINILRKKGLKVHFRVAFNPVDCIEYELVNPDGDNNLADYYRNVDIMVAPATLQLGAVHYPVIEAMACGTPIITTGYYPANEENSYLVPISSPDIIAMTIEYIICNYDDAKNRSEKALAEIQRFDWKDVSLSMLMIISNTMEGK